MTVEFTIDQLREVRRGFVDLDEGQVHYRTCGRSDRGLPLVMLHGSPGSSYSLLPQALRLALGRRVICLDTPGNGDSSPLANPRPEIADYAGAHLRALRALGVERFDLYGYHTGSGIAIEMTLAQSVSVRRLILDGVSLFTPTERDGLFRGDHAPEISIDLEGTQFTKCLHMVRDAHLFWPWWNRNTDKLRGRGLPSADYLHGEVLEVLKAVRSYHLTYRAALRYDKSKRLPLLTLPVLVACAPRDQLFTWLDAAAKLVPNSQKRMIAGIDTERDVESSVAAFVDFLDQL